MLKKIIIAVIVVACAAMSMVEPIAQDLAYHQFADQRAWGFVPNAWNVLSNLGFLLVGLMGLWQLHVTRRLNILPAIKRHYSIFLLGVTLVAFGSGYYHWQPDNQTLIWDRLPITLAFMALLTVVFAEFLSVDWARYGLWPLLLLGLLSVVYWYGFGDLRPYVLVQFLPMILMLILFTFGHKAFAQHSGYWWLFAAYVGAKLFEHFDRAIFDATGGVMAGHAIKHIFAALGLYALLRRFEQRRSLHY